MKRWSNNMKQLDVIQTSSPHNTNWLVIILKSVSTIINHCQNGWCYQEKYEQEHEKNAIKYVIIISGLFTFLSRINLSLKWFEVERFFTFGHFIQFINANFCVQSISSGARHGKTNQGVSTENPMLILKA